MSPLSDSGKRSVLITGCSPGGIGHAIAKEYYSKGFLVFATARRLEVLEDLKAMGMTTMALDVTDVKSVQVARDRVSEITGGKLDILINNAGQPYTAPGPELELERIRALFSTNVFGVMTMVKEFVKLVIKSQGQIINIGSIAADVPLPFMGAYAASKSAVHAYGDALRVELAPFGVTVVSVVTGGVETIMNPGSSDTMASPIKPGSLYEPMQAVYLELNKKRQSTHKIKPEVYARRLVGTTLDKNPGGRIHVGTMSSTLWLLNIILPKSALAYIGAKAYGMTQLKSLLQATSVIH